MPDCSATIENTDIAIQMPTITASRTRACFFDPIRIPYVTTRANGMIRIAQISMKFVSPVPFSKGCAELTL